MIGKLDKWGAAVSDSRGDVPANAIIPCSVGASQGANLGVIERQSLDERKGKLGTNFGQSFGEIDEAPAKALDHVTTLARGT